MDRNSTSRPMQRLIGAMASCALAAMAIAIPTMARADQVEHHNELVYQFITQMRANPLVADCAAHGDFVVGTSSAFNHVEFPRSSFDPAHAEVKPWNGSFDRGKQRIKVDSIVTVEGVGVRKDGSTMPNALKFRCGYVDAKMLAFSWNDPVAPFKRAAPSRQAGKTKKALRGSGRKSPAKAAGKGTGKKGRRR
ncbi:BspC domain-containing protein [Mycetohabitans sp. B46]|uniref:BspC domain-containing protein n=1 Tax=Mycetohabitans sp. B46 TaxID=2772536 RepID=UPI00307D8B34